MDSGSGFYFLKLRLRCNRDVLGAKAFDPDAFISSKARGLLSHPDSDVFWSYRSMFLPPSPFNSVNNTNELSSS